MYDVNEKQRETKALIDEFALACDTEHFDGILVMGLKTGDSTLFLKSLSNSMSAYEWLGVLEHIKQIVYEEVK